MTSLPITPPSARVATAPKGSSPPTHGGAGDFAALLDQTTARTAPAEGPKNRPARPEPAQRREDRVPRGRDEAANPADAPAPQPAGGDAAARPDATTPADAPAQDAAATPGATQAPADPAAGVQAPTAEP